MKKLILVLVSIGCLFACSGKEKPQAQQNFPPCTINGHDCWEVVQLLTKTKAIYPSEEEKQKIKELYEKETGHKAWNLLIEPHYENEKLTPLNLSVVTASAFYDGGSMQYKLSNGVTVFRKWNSGFESGEPIGFFRTFISFPTQESFVFNKTGKMIEHTPPQPSQEN